mgnify:FL=1|tara:strand:- start:253 stop:426 length:174 start_codon:yes stop_codon:yes gene_type:complete
MIDINKSFIKSISYFNLIDLLDTFRNCKSKYSGHNKILSDLVEAIEIELNKRENKNG